MTSEQFDKIIDLLKLFGLIAGGVIAIWRFFTWLENRDKEKSVGAAAVAELRTEDVEIRKDLAKMKEHEQVQDRQIDELEEHYDKLINRVWDFFKK
jgi:hypothetical protein